MARYRWANFESALNWFRTGEFLNKNLQKSGF